MYIKDSKGKEINDFSDWAKLYDTPQTSQCSIFGISSYMPQPDLPPF